MNFLTTRGGPRPRQARDRAERGPGRLRRAQRRTRCGGMAAVPGQVISSPGSPPPADGHAPRPGASTRACSLTAPIVAARRLARGILLRDIPLTRGGSIGFQVENAMAAVAAPGAPACPGTPSAGAWPALPTTPTTPRPLQRDGLPRRHRDRRLRPQRRRHRRLSWAPKSPCRPTNVVGRHQRRRRPPRRRPPRPNRILGDAPSATILYEDACQRGREASEVVACCAGLRGAKRTSTSKDRWRVPTPTPPAQLGRSRRRTVTPLRFSP